MGGLFETSTLKGDLKNLYNKQEVLDYNVYGVTHKCKDAKSNNFVALRIINKKYLERVCGTKNLENCFDVIRKEIDAIKKMDGDYSLHLIEGTEVDDSFYIITDIWDSTLEKYLIDNKNGLSVDEIKNIFKKLNIAFKRMADLKIIHGNLKLSNILIKNDKNEIIPILSDYGQKANLDEKLNIMQSTSQYSAPELLVGDKYNYKIDLWSIGIILYQLYFNEFPFDGETQVAIYNDIKKKKYLKRCEENYYFNDLIKKLLVLDPNNRLTWEQYFNHKFWNLGEDENNNENENNANKENNENAENDNDNKNDYKYIYQRQRDPNYKYYNIFYCLIDKENKDDNKNLENIKKIEIEVDKNDKNQQLDNLIYNELTKKVQTEDLTKLMLYGCNLKNIEFLTNLNIENLLELDLSRNEINSIEPLANISYDKLITLNLSHNNIYDIEPLTKASFIYLKNLNLSHNLINDIEPLSKFPFNNLDKLKLSSNKIRDIQVLTKIPFINLTYLDLKNNKISEASKALAFISINNLISLDLSHNSIKSVEGLNANQYKNLQTLELGDNDISNLDLLKDVYFNDLTKLSLYDNNIENVYIFGEVPFKNLIELNLSYNNIDNVDFINYMVFQNLEKLDLNGNKISDLTPLNQSNLEELKEFQLKNNKLKENEGNEIILNNLRMKYNNLKLVSN